MRKRLTFANIAAVLALVVAISLTPAGAHVTKRFSHLWGSHIKPKLATPGTLNASGNPVDWTKLKSVPSDIADGDANSFSGYEYITGTAVDVANGATGSSTTYCSTFDKEVLGGGYYANVSNVDASASYPFDAGSFFGSAFNAGWSATVRNNSGGAAQLTTYVICADTDQTESA